MLKLHIPRWKGKCPKHPRFNPEAAGRGAVRGNCEACHTLCNVHISATRLVTELCKADSLLRRLEVTP